MTSASLMRLSPSRCFLANAPCPTMQIFIAFLLRSLSLWERRREAPGEGRKSRQILKPSPCPLPEGEGRVKLPQFKRNTSAKFGETGAGVVIKSVLPALECELIGMQMKRRIVEMMAKKG